jgi:RHS repeat-associated protein
MSGNLLLASGNLDEIYAQVGSSSTTSYLRDGVKSTVALTSSSASISANYYYSPYGDSAKTGTATTPLQFTGRENDGATGLYYYRARYYSPQLGRFTSEDPIGVGGGSNLYAYAGGNPISHTDPRGLTWAEIEIATKIYGGIALGAWSMLHPTPLNCSCGGHPNWKLIGAAGNFTSAYVIAEHAGPGEFFLYGTGVVAAGVGGWEAGTYLNYVVECDVLAGRESIGGLIYGFAHGEIAMEPGLL